MTSSNEITANFTPIEVKYHRATFYLRDEKLYIKIPLAVGQTALQDSLNTIDRPATLLDTSTFRDEYNAFQDKHPDFKPSFPPGPAVLSPLTEFQKEQAQLAALREKAINLKQEIIDNRNQGARLLPKPNGDYASIYNQEPMKNGMIVPSTFDAQTALINSKGNERK